MDWNQAKDTILGFMATGAFMLLAYEIRKLRESVEKLNLQVAKIVVQTQNHDKQLDDHNERIRELEGNRI